MHKTSSPLAPWFIGWVGELKESKRMSQKGYESFLKKLLDFLKKHGILEE